MGSCAGLPVPLLCLLMSLGFTDFSFSLFQAHVLPLAPTPPSSRLLPECILGFVMVAFALVPPDHSLILPSSWPQQFNPSLVCASLPLWWDFCVQDSSAAPLCARVKATLHTWALTTLWVLSDGNQLSMRKKADAGASPMLWAGLSARARPSRESWV